MVLVSISVLMIAFENKNTWTHGMNMIRSKERNSPSCIPSNTSGCSSEVPSLLFFEVGSANMSLTRALHTAILRVASDDLLRPPCAMCYGFMLQAFKSHRSRSIPLPLLLSNPPSARQLSSGFSKCRLCVLHRIACAIAIVIHVCALSPLYIFMLVGMPCHYVSRRPLYQ